MKVFISWSGPLSQQLGEALRNWLPAALQLVKPYFTPADIEKGARWESDISKELDAASVGVFCMTRSNLNSSWMLFEAGAIAKRLSKSHVCPILFDVDPTDLAGPLQQFQATPYCEKEIKQLFKVINASLGDSRLADATLDEVFQMWWPRLDANIQGILAGAEQNSDEPIRSEREILDEILQLSRLSSRRISPRHSLSSGALEALLEGYIRTYELASSGSSPLAILGGMQSMHKAIDYIGTRSDRDDVQNLRTKISTFDYEMNSDGEDEIPF